MNRNLFTKTLGALCLSVFLLSSNVYATTSIQFNNTSNYNLDGIGPHDSVVGDFNGDGNNDFIVTRSVADNVDGATTDAIEVFLGNGTGGFTKNSPIRVGFRPRGISSGDFNEDGVLDIAITEGARNSDKALFGATVCGANVGTAIYTGNGNGNFTFASCVHGGDFPIRVATSDFNNDGHDDIVVTNNTSNYASVFLGNGNGTFGSQISLPANNTLLNAVVVADLNNDGNMDVVVGNYGYSASVFLGDGAGNFAQSNLFVGMYMESIASGDINNDGNVDLAVSEQYGSRIMVFTGMGNGQFVGPQVYTTAGYGVSLNLKDLDNDGTTDLAVANSNTQLVSVFVGNGSTLGSRLDFGTGVWPETLAVGDWNNDSYLDFATANRNYGQDGTVSVLMQQPVVVPTPTPTPVPTVTPTPIVTPTPSISPTPTPLPSVNPTPSISPTPSPTPVVTPTPVGVEETLESTDAEYNIGDRKLVVSTKDSLGNSVTLWVLSGDGNYNYGEMKNTKRSSTFSLTARKAPNPGSTIIILSSTGNSWLIPVKN